MKLTIEQSNKLIAEFMGVEFNSIGDKCNHPLITAPWPPIECLKYHKSWNWLMPVVEKIETLHNGVCNEYFWNKEDAKQHNDFRIFRVKEISDLHGQIVNFIEWYNLNTVKEVEG